MLTLSTDVTLEATKHTETEAEARVRLLAEADAAAKKLDEYGRDSAERTVELQPHDAEMIDREVTAGEHQTYGDALTYVIGRGLAEIARARKAAQELKAARAVKEQGKLYSEMLKVNPALVTDPVFVAKMIAALGVIAPTPAVAVPAK